jgi:hypothetical protein
MRDIREDLRQRLMKISAQRAEIQARLEWLNEMEAHVKAALEYERVQAESDQVGLFLEEPSDSERSVTSQFIHEVLSDLKGRTLDELKAAALRKGLTFGEKNPGRVLHFALVGMKQGGIVDRDSDGRWRLLDRTSGVAPM